MQRLRHLLTKNHQKFKYLKIILSDGFIGSINKISLPLMKTVPKELTKSVLRPLGLTAATSAADVGIHKKSYGPDQKHQKQILKTL